MYLLSNFSDWGLTILHLTGFGGFIYLVPKKGKRRAVFGTASISPMAQKRAKHNPTPIVPGQAIRATATNHVASTEKSAHDRDTPKDRKQKQSLSDKTTTFDGKSF